MDEVSLQVMWQNLRRSPSDPRCPEMWEVPVQWGTGNVVAMVYGSTTSSGEASKAECVERAKLFSAAPDLLEACKDALNFCVQNGYGIVSMQGELEKAIAKAKGE